MYLFPSGFASVGTFTLIPLKMPNIVLCSKQTSHSFHFILNHLVTVNSAGCCKHRDEQSQIWAYKSHTIWWKD